MQPPSSKTKTFSFDQLMNRNEYFHLASLCSFFVLGVWFFDLTSVYQRGFSLSLATLIGGIYLIGPHSSKLSFLSDEECKNRTNYEIVGPFGLVLIVLWVAWVDYSMPTPPSKYTGILLIFTVINLLQVRRQITDRSKKRVIKESTIIIHNYVMFILAIAMHLTATRYFLIEGVWEWHIETPFEFFHQVLFERY